MGQNLHANMEGFCRAGHNYSVRSKISDVGYVRIKILQYRYCYAVLEYDTVTLVYRYFVPYIFVNQIFITSYVHRYMMEALTYEIIPTNCIVCIVS